MPLPQNFHAFLGAAVLGAVSAAGLFLFEHFRQERQRHQMAKDLARLDEELTSIKKELNHILTTQKEKPRKNRKQVSGSRANSAMSNASQDGFVSASEVDSSDLEFYDVSDEETTQPLGSPEHVEPLGSPEPVGADPFKDIDKDLNKGDLYVLQSTLEKLNHLSKTDPKNADVLWRIGKNHSRICEKLGEKDEELKKKHIAKGIEACKEALEYSRTNGMAHKWCAILLGKESDYLSLRERILSSEVFRQHVICAMEQFPNDATLFYMMGRLSYELAGMKWYERKIASAIAVEPPAASYDDALQFFKQSEEFSTKPMKANRLYIAKCEIALGKYESALNWLDLAEQVTEGYDATEDAETKKLLEQYKSYR